VGHSYHKNGLNGLGPMLRKQTGNEATHDAAMLHGAQVTWGESLG